MKKHKRICYSIISMVNDKKVKERKYYYIDNNKDYVWISKRMVFPNFIWSTTRREVDHFLSNISQMKPFDLE